MDIERKELTMVQEPYVLPDKTIVWAETAVENGTRLFTWNTRDASWYFEGDLGVAQKELEIEGVEYWQGINAMTGNPWVELDMGRKPTGPGTGNIFGTGDTFDTAWRYAIGAECLPDSPEDTDPAMTDFSTLVKEG